MPRYDYKPFEYKAPPGLSAKEPRHPVAIIGAGPIGLALAIDLALQGIKSVVLDDNNVVSIGSRAICWAKRTLEIFDRLGVGEQMLEKGVTWKVGRLFHGDEEIYNFDLLPEEGHKFPAFINLQQYHVEQYLVERAQAFPDLIDLRFKNKVVDHTDNGEHVLLSIETPNGHYSLEADYVIACDGAGSPTRKRMGLAFEGQTFEEHFLIVDVEMEESPFETETAERWFWFEPAFHQGQSALLHKQPDNIYRIDLQLGFDTDPAEEVNDEKVQPRIKAIVGEKPFKVDWKSVYKFRCARLENFVHNRVIFAGDSAHVVSPFGARGGNGGIQDVDNLGWKLAAIVKGEAGSGLLESYDQERSHAADENIRNSSRATNFMTPKSSIEHLFRSEVLHLAKDQTFARKLINSGRLSVPCSLNGFALETPSGEAVLQTGEAALDAPLKNGTSTDWLLNKTGGEFSLVSFGQKPKLGLNDIPHVNIASMCDAEPEDYADITGLAFKRYGKGLTYLFRPDQHVAAVFSNPSDDAVLAAKRKALGHD
ncbi:MAG: FAD-dependent oxidoreductase [Pseudomonadota bacterium]